MTKSEGSKAVRSRDRFARWVLGGSVRGASLVALSIGFASASVAAEDASDKIETVTVTAERRATTEKEVPVSVSTLGGPLLDALTSGGPDIRFLSSRVPSLNIESSFGRTFPRFYIRGLGNTDFDLNASQPVSVVYDEVVLENPILKAFPVFDVEQIEVLRGPQGTLFGRNTPAGVVKIDSRRPTSSYEGYANLSYGRFNAVNFDGAIGGPVVENKLNFRLSLLNQRQDDWVKNTIRNGRSKDLEGFNDFAGRVQLEFIPSDNFKGLLNIHARSLDGTARVFRGSAFVKGSPNLIIKDDEVSQNGRNYQRLNTQGVSFTGDYDAGPVTITSVTAWERGSVYTAGDIDGTAVNNPPLVPFQSETSDNIPLLNQVTQELRYTSNDWGRFINQGGIFYFHEKVKITNDNYEADNTLSGHARAAQTTNSVGVFESLKYKLTDIWTVGGGVRWSMDEKSFSATRSFSPGFLGFTSGQTYKSSPDSANVSWDVSTNYDLSNEVTLYGRVARGYRGPAVQGRVIFSNGISTAKAERTLSYEAGVKTTLFDNKMKLNAGGYTYTTRDIQLTAVGGAGNTQQLINAAEVGGYGAEVDMEAKPIPRLLLTAGFGYNSTEIKDSNRTIDACGGGRCTVLNKIVSTDPFTNTPRVNINGNPLPQAPEFSVNWSARYSVPAGPSGEFFGLTDWSWRSSVNFFLYDAVEFRGNPLLLGGLKAGYRDFDRGFEVAAFGRNILNDVQAVSAIDFNNLTGMINEPAIWGVVGNITF